MLGGSGQHTAVSEKCQFSVACLGIICLTEQVGSGVESGVAGKRSPHYGGKRAFNLLKIIFSVAYFCTGCFVTNNRLLMKDNLFRH